MLLDGDAVRGRLVPRHGYDPASREAFYTTLANLAALLAEQGRIVLVPATAHLRAFRDHARAVAPRFLEVHVATPLDVAAAQDVGRADRVYAVAQGQVPGVDIAYEPPLAPDVVITPENRHRSVELVLARLFAAPEAAAALEGHGIVSVSRSTYVSIALRPGAHEPAQRVICDRCGLIPRSELHITLAYLGDAEVPRLLALHSALVRADIDWASLRLRAAGLGAAVGEEEPRPASAAEEIEPGADLPRVVWWAVEPVEPLLRVRDEVIAAVRAAGLSTQLIEDFYWPHVTLGSAGPGGGGGGDEGGGGAGARDWSRWDVRLVPKTACVELAEAGTPVELELAAVHVTNTRTHPESLLPVYRWR